MDPAQPQPAGTRVNLPKFLQAAYKTSCVTGKWVALASQLQAAQLPTPPAQVVAASDPPARKSSHYTVRKGDTLYAIALRFHCDNVGRLVRDNHLRSAGDLRVGERLSLASCKRR